MDKFVFVNEDTRYKEEKGIITIEQLSWNKKDIRQIHLTIEELRKILGES